MWTFFQRCRSSFSSSALRAARAGFTLVELLVVVAVITIITAFLLFNQGKFDSSTLLRSLAYSVGLSIRQAQLYGTSVRGFTQSGVTNFAPGYGINLTSGDLTHYYIFADLNGNGTLDTGPVDERLSTSGTSLITIGNGYQVSKFCATVGAVQDCYPNAGGGTLSSLTIYFKRPNPDASFSAACSGTCAGVYTGAYIQLKSNGSSDTRSVSVTNTGQVSVCPLNMAPPAC